MPSILFVYIANQCRSPTAEVMFVAKLATVNQSEKWIIGSAGTAAAEEIIATPYARQVMAGKRLNLESHRSPDADIFFTPP